MAACLSRPLVRRDEVGADQRNLARSGEAAALAQAKPTQASPADECADALIAVVAKEPSPRAISQSDHSELEPAQIIVKVCEGQIESASAFLWGEVQLGLVAAVTAGQRSCREIWRVTMAWLPTDAYSLMTACCSR